MNTKRGFTQHYFSAKHKNSAGFIALISVLIVGAIVLVISIGLSLRSVGETNVSLGEQESGRALALANLCAEQALMKLESVLNYAGGESVTVGSDTCDILTIGGSGNQDRTVKIQATSTTANGTYVRKVKVEVSQISPVMQISSWEGVADF